MEILQDFEDTAFTMLLYGGAGIGKTSFAAKCDQALIANLENGLKGIELKKYGTFATSHIGSWQEVQELMQKMAGSEKFKTLVIDSITKMQDLITSAICEESRKKSLADFAYGAGFQRFAAEAQVFCELMDMVKAQGKNVICIAHEQVETFADPEDDAFDRFNVSLDKRIAEKIKASVDHVWYMHYEKTIKEASSGRSQAKHRGRILVQTRATGGVVAKTRGEREQWIEVKNDETAKRIWQSL